MIFHQYKSVNLKHVHNVIRCMYKELINETAVSIDLLTSSSLYIAKIRVGPSVPVLASNSPITNVITHED